ncbi:hypothetical protein HCN44_000625 [Aphidius gifuensis]|uniref:JNK1/MAPK8-associated membrane protein n=1 Tax=Aphidius gifuensis TaxID=684658 RepID=A0A834XS51_APHGI|nr:JNK1/MAPK8-associated membrane protein [Aphidius gifuensis]XP_044011634.1 JNK1/MAPK8-associated membrane protein [Aphidius gifuensis]KAF7990820.1 hypothetical protein HCN44_000625 [Aphidius gifuensis]
MNFLEGCPGLYCGRSLLTDGNWSDCGVCARGFKSNESSACVPCEDNLTLYDWFYLSFIAVFVLVLHWFFIDVVTKRRNIPQEVIIIHISALFETALASLITLHVTDPIGTYDVRSCKTKRLSDWYTLFYNPSPNYETLLYCTQEAVYPLYTMVFVFYSLGAIIMLLIRPLIVRKFLPKRGKLTVYAALYFYPILALSHAVGGGLIYYSFPYITIILTVLSSAAHFAFKLNQTMKSLLLSSVTDFKNIVVILGHWLLQAFGIMAVATLKDIDIHPAMFIFVPFPALFYILTARFTDPHKLHIE